MKPIEETTMSSQSFTNPAENSLAWTAVWKHCILRSVLHHLRDEILTSATEAASMPTADSWHTQLVHRRL